MDAKLLMLIVTNARDIIASTLASAERANQDGAMSFEQLDAIRRAAGMTNDEYQAVVDRARLEAGLIPRERGD